MLRASGLPALGPVVPAAGSEARIAEAADDLLERGTVPSDLPLLPLLRWSAQERDVLFHGSQRGDLELLEPIRLTRDETPFGDQQAVFASSDPVWAIYFATLRRGDGFHSTRNGSIGLADALYPRWYFFSHNAEALGPEWFGDGWLYLLPAEGFRRQPSILGVFDSAQWASPAAVVPRARIPVSAAHFPFVDYVFAHRDDERIPTTILRAMWAGRRTRGRGTDGERASAT